MPTNNPSGLMKRLTVWPHGSFFVLYEHSMPLRFKLPSCLFDIVNVKLKPSVWCGDLSGQEFLPEARSATCESGHRAKVFAPCSASV